MVSNVKMKQRTKVKKMQITVRMEELFPVIDEYIRKKLRLKQNQRLIYTSKTSFITFALEDVNESKDETTT